MMSWDSDLGLVQFNISSWTFLDEELKRMLIRMIRITNTLKQK